MPFLAKETPPHGSEPLVDQSGMGDQADDLRASYSDSGEKRLSTACAQHDSSALRTGNGRWTMRQLLRANAALRWSRQLEGLDNR